MCNVKKKILAGNAVIGRMSEEDGGQTETGEAKVFFYFHFFFALIFFFVSHFFFASILLKLLQEPGQTNNLNLLLISQLYKPYFSGKKNKRTLLLR